MRVAFEVRETDLLGRIGTLRVGGRTLETPYMFPVVHPVNQQVPTKDLRSMGFGGVMTNSYILHSRRKEEAIEKGLHSLLNFDGVVMTDSGGYQVLVYGELDLGYKEVAAFQAAIRSDLAVTLDRPTGYPQTRRIAVDTVDYSLRNAKATLKEFGGKETVWVGPIQGGLYSDLVKLSAKALVAAGFEFLALGSPVQVMQNYMFADLVQMITGAREAIPYSMPLHLFGAGHPLTMALAVALGCDTFDSASYVIFARSGRYLTRGGVMTLQTMKYLPCSCPVCVRTSARELQELGHPERTRLLSLHNLWVLREELESCKEAISEGRLWDLVEERSMAHPALRDAFVELARHSKQLAAGTPAMKERGLFIRSQTDLVRPEILAAADRLRLATRRRSLKARLVPEGRVIGRSKGSKARGEDVYGVHPVLGPYPLELGFQYPFSQTETSSVVSPGGFDDAKKALRSLGYRSVTVEEESAVGRFRSKRSRRGVSPSPPSSSAPPR